MLPEKSQEKKNKRIGAVFYIIAATSFIPFLGYTMGFIAMILGAFKGMRLFFIGFCGTLFNVYISRGSISEFLPGEMIFMALIYIIIFGIKKIIKIIRRPSEERIIPTVSSGAEQVKNDIGKDKIIKKMERNRQNQGDHVYSILEEKLNERLAFYKNAYDDTRKQIQELSAVVDNSETLLNTQCYNMVDLLLGKDIDQEERRLLYKKVGLNIIDFDKKFEGLQKERGKKLERLKSDARYKEYLRLTIDEDLKMALELEGDDIFNHIIEEGFLNDSFRNEPCINFILFKYQPRYWKYAKAADATAKKHGFTDRKQMFEVWRKLRSAFNSLAGEKRINDVLAECAAIEKEIKELADKMENVGVEYADEVKKRLVEILKRAPEEKYDLFNREEVDNIIRMKQEVISQKEQLKPLNNRLTIIMENINNVEKMIYSAGTHKLDLNKVQLTEFFECTNPSEPIHRLIPEKKWQDIEKAFLEFGVQLKDRQNYSIVETHLTKKEKERLLKKYNVQEGEIFIDEDLARPRV